MIWDTQKKSIQQDVLMKADDCDFAESHRSLIIKIIVYRSYKKTMTVFQLDILAESKF